MENITINDYHLDTKATFKDISDSVYTKAINKNFEELTDYTQVCKTGNKLAKEILKTIKEMGFKPQFKSRSVFGFGSEYFYKESTNELMRISDHFQNWIGSCSWFLDTGNYNRFMVSPSNPKANTNKRVVPKIGVINLNEMERFE